MANEPGTLEQIAQEMGRALSRLEVLLAPENFSTLLIELGVDTSPEFQADDALLKKLSETVDKAAVLGPEIENVALAFDSGSDSDLATAAGQLLAAIRDVISAVDALVSDFQRAAAGVMDTAALEAFVEVMASRIFENILVRYLESHYPRFCQVLAMITIVEYASFDVITDNGPDTVLRRRLHFDRIAMLLSNPLDLLQAGYGWGTEQFDGKALFFQLSDSFEAFQQLADYAEVSSDGTPIFDLFAMTFGTTKNVHPPGLEAKLFVDLPSTTDLTLAQISDNCRVAFQFSTSLAAGLTLQMLPPTSIELDADATVAGSAVLGLVGIAPDGKSPFLLFGQTAGSSLQATQVEAGLVADFRFDAATNKVRADAGLLAKFVGGKLTVDLSSADGFLTAVSPQDGLKAAFDLTLGWSTLRGFYMEGGASLELVLPLHIRLGPIALELLNLDLGIAADGLTASASLAASVELGPITATIDGVGVSSQLAFKRGNLGPLDFGVVFKPPNGLGLEIDAGVVVGGGFISFNPDNGQYAGVLEVELAETIQVKVIGILDTILPDGSPGYSLLLIVTFDLPPIQLGLGFTLNGVGGLFGAHRTMAVDALRSGLRAHTLNSVLFPPDPIANAPQIISNVRSFFPPANGRFVFGPMLELGWGSPTLITMALGVILEVPDPVRLAIIGLIDAALPSTDAGLIELHIDVLGTIDFAAKKLAIDGTLFDSSVLIYALSGDLAMRLAWGSDSNFLFSLGGFNPHFNTAGLDLPPLKRMAVSIGDGDNPRISSNSYLAITSNTLQFGANTEVYASAGGFSVHGYLGFDVLVVYSPFSFTFDFKASFDVAVDGLTLTSFDIDGTFSGPRPWHLHAHVSIHLLFFDIGASLTLEWGDSTPVALPQRAVLPDLMAALGDARNWSAQLPEGGRQAVTLVLPKAGETPLRVHPMGTLTVRETVVPLDLPITRYAEGAPADGSLFAIGDVLVNNNEEAAMAFQDYFATAQFVSLSDADKLSKPSFERYDAGVTIGSAGMEAGAAAPRAVRYEERIIDVDSGFSRFTRIYAMPGDIHAALSRQGAGTQSAVKNGGMGKYQSGPAAAAITASDPGYVVAGVDDLTIRADIASAAGTAYFQAQAAMATHLALHPEDEGQLQIVPLHEVAA